MSRRLFNVLGACIVFGLSWAGLAGAAEPVRVATLLPYVGDAIDQLGADVSLVASVRPQNGTPVREGVVDLGSPHSPNFEHLAVSRPDLVVADGRFHQALTEPLKQSGARLFLVEGSSLEATYEGLEQVAEAAGVESSMARLIADSRRSLETYRLAEPMAVLPLFGAPGSYMAITPRTWFGDLLDELGFENLAADLAGRETFPGYVQISDEVVATLDPDLVLLLAHGNPEVVEEAFLAEAAKGGPWTRLAPRIRVLDPQVFGANPGLALPTSAEVLIQLVGEGTGGR